MNVRYRDVTFMDIHKPFGQQVRRLRILTGATQEQLAKAARLAAASISNIERGAHPPAFHRLPRIAKALRVKLHELFLFDD